MKKADGFANPLWSAVSLVLLALFVVLQTKALEVLPVGTAYAVWTGIGATGTVIAGIVLSPSPRRRSAWPASPWWWRESSA